MNAPIELITADIISLIFLLIGSVYLMMFAKSFGTKKMKTYLTILSIMLIAMALLNDGVEVFEYKTQSYGHVLGYLMVIIGTAFAIISLLSYNEMKSLMNFSIKNVKRKSK